MHSLCSDFLSLVKSYLNGVVLGDKKHLHYSLYVVECSVMNESYELKFSGIGRLYGLKSMERLNNSHICVVGVGGVGSWCAEALARSGVGEITLVDMDDVCITNVNRQLPALESTVGRTKVSVLKERLQLINSELSINTITDFYTKTTAETIITNRFSYVVDAIDSIDNKALLVSQCVDLNIPVITSGGAGGLRDISRIAVSDLAKTQGDSLLRVLRKKLRNKHGFSKDIKQEFNVKAVYSDEKAVFPTPEGGVCELRDQNSRLKLDCSAGFGTATFITGGFGFALAGAVVKDISDGLLQ